MVKQALPKPFKYACEKGKIVVQQNDGKVAALLSHSDKVIWRIVNNALSGKGLLQTSEKGRSNRAPQLSTIERELSELKKVVEALAVRTITHKHNAHFLDEDAMTVLDAEVAYRLLDDPPEPNEALRHILSLR